MNPSAQKNSSCNKENRAARTERYIKRLSKEQSCRFSENLRDLGNKPSVIVQGRTHQELQLSMDHMDSPSAQNELFQPSRQSPWFSCWNSNTFPVQKSVENLQQSRMVSPSFPVRSSTDLTKHPNKQFITESNQANDRNDQFTSSFKYYGVKIRENQLLKTASNNSVSATCNTLESMHTPIKREITQDSFNLPNDVSTMNRESRLIENREEEKEQEKCDQDLLERKQTEKNVEEALTELEAIYDSLHLDDEELLDRAELRCMNEFKLRQVRNKVFPYASEKSIDRTRDDMAYRRMHPKERPASLSVMFNQSTLSPILSCKNATDNYLYAANRMHRSEPMHTPIKREITQDSFNLPNDVSTMNRESRLIENREEEKEQEKCDQDVLERKQTEKNVDEALTELEAIYDTLHLDDEELLDRAELRCMNEFKLRQARNKVFPYISEKSIDRTRDDMAYRRMHPKERPASLSEMFNQSTLSPILSCKSATDNYLYAANRMHRSEPDVTRDDVVYRSIHRANNTLKVIDPQSPFGIPLGPVITTTESDYLHTTPTKLDRPRSLYIPQCEPDIVTDDLAYRPLRKDANIFKITANKNDQEIIRDQEPAFETKKKLAVRSFSANLYDLTNYDGIHLRREPSLQEIIREGMSNEMTIDIDSLSTLTDKRVVSDGEFSDYHTRWRSNNLLSTTKIDISGKDNPVINACKKKLRSYVSPSAQNIEEKRKNKKKPISTTSDDLLMKALNNELCQDCDQTACRCTCQDLINLIDGRGNPETEPIMETNICSNDSNKTDESSALQIQSLGSHYSGNASQDYKECTDKEDVKELTKSLVNAVCEKDVSEKTDNNTSDFYFRVADKNFKITETFSSVADHLRGSRLIVTHF